ncbi:response regulator [Flavobacteriaceae bacterium AU392]|nr:DNA-binding response regulator [Flavobacteriaceae bacterium]RKM85978.1 response regulator [Flavobacteriaceae bacterium AU392]
MKLRCIIIDDEFLARQRLLKLLESFGGIIVVGECRNGSEALEKIALKEPDLIFLDIQMPDMNGFMVYDQIKKKPKVIFTTAYDSYAIEAFKINAVDYLLKPFDEERIAIAINRVLGIQKRSNSFDIEGKIKQLLRRYEADEYAFTSQISISSKGREVNIDIDDIIYFKSDGNYVKIITEQKTFLYRSTLNALNEALNPSQFLRIHRSLILNTVYIKVCAYLNNNEYKFRLKNDEEFTSSRSYNSQVAEYLSNKKDE